MDNHKRVNELEFGLEMLRWEGQGVYPLEMVSSFSCSDFNGVFYQPVIPKYQPQSSELLNLITGSLDGYSTRKELLACIGHCWDLATDHNESMKL